MSRIREVQLDLGDRLTRKRIAYIEEPHEGDWANNNEWGNSFSGLMPGAAGIQKNVAALNSTPGPPRVYTVQLFRNDINSLANSDVRAVVTYGVGAVNNSFLVDWLHGVQFSLVANYIRVDFVTYAPAAADPYSVTADPLLLAASFGAGSVPGRSIVTLTEPTVVIPGSGGTQSYPVPDFARAFLPSLVNVAAGFNSPTVATSIFAICFSGGASLQLAARDLQIFNGGLAATGFPIPGGTSFVRIVNNSGLASQQVTMQWFLSL